MNQPLLSERLRLAIQDITAVARHRAAAEAEMESTHQAATAAADKEFRKAEDATQETYDRLQSLAIERFQEKTQDITAKFEAEHEAKSKQYSAKQLKCREEHDIVKEAIDVELKETRWAIDTILEADKKVAKDELVATQRAVESTVEKINDTHLEIIEQIKDWKRTDWMSLADVSPSKKEEFPDALAGLKSCRVTNEIALEKMQKLTAPKLLKGYRLPMLFVFVWLISLSPIPLMGDDWYFWLAATVAGVTAIGLVVWYLLMVTFRRQFFSLYRIAKQALVDSEVLQQRCLDDAGTLYKEKILAAQYKFDEAFEAAKGKHNSKRAAAKNRRDKLLEEHKNKYEPMLESLQQQRDEGLKKAENKYQGRMSASNEQYEKEMNTATAEKKAKMDSARQEYQSKLNHLCEEWQQAVNRFSTVIREVSKECAELFPDWSAFAGEGWQTPAAVPLAMPIGEMRVGFDIIPDGQPTHERLAELVPEPCSVPALLPFPRNGSLLLKARGDGRQHGISLLQAVMLRCLTAIPPAKVRFTILDPVGLGENFAAFTHLADHDEKLVTSRIWTETEHIEQRLTDLTEHIENVIQKYLRNQFETLEDYNEFAGEVAEPYRVLVVAHFPVNFSEEAARRLLSIANSGSKCGT